MGGSNLSNKLEYESIERVAEFFTHVFINKICNFKYYVRTSRIVKLR